MFNGRLQFALPETAVCSGGDVVAEHEFLGEVLAAFEPCAGPLRADHRNASELRVLADAVVQTIHQGCFRAYHHDLDPFFQQESTELLVIIEVQLHIATMAHGPGVPRGNIEFIQ